MLTINVKTDFAPVHRMLEGLRRQAPFAIAKALTDTAADVQAGLTREISTVFEQPVRFTQQGVGITPARKDTLRAVVFLKRKQAAYLQAQIEGGSRRRKPFEARFAQTLAQQIKAALPGKAAPLTAAGNVSRAQITRLARESKRKGGKVFSVPEGGKLAPGIYERKGRRGIKPLLIFSAQPARYRRRFDFYGIGRRVIAQRFAVNAKRAMDLALATAR